jgi:hypothetical protein
MRVAESGSFAADEKVAGQCHLEAAGDGDAVHRSDQWLAQRRPPAARIARILERDPDLGDLLQVKPGAERGVGAGENHDRHVLVGVGSAHARAQGLA